MLLHGPGLHSILATTIVELVRLNSELLGTMCKKRHDAVVVMVNKHFITLVSVQIVVIAFVGWIVTHLQLVKIPRPLVQ